MRQTSILATSWLAVMAGIAVMAAFPRQALALDPPQVVADDVGGIQGLMEFGEFIGKRRTNMDAALQGFTGLYQAAKQPAGKARLGLRVATDLMVQYRYADAEKILGEVVELATANKLGNELVFALLRRAEIAEMYGREQDAWAALQQAEGAAAADPRYAGNVKAQLGRMLIERGDYANALAKLQEANKIGKDAGDTESQALGMLFFGQMKERQGDLTTARRAIAGALQIIGDPDNASLQSVKGTISLELARFMQRQFEREEANAALKAAHESFDKGGDTIGASLVWIELGQNFYDIGSYSQADKVFTVAATELKDNNVSSPPTQARLLGLMGRNQIAIGNLDDAASKIEQAMKLLGQGGAARLQVELLRYKGALARARGAYQAALDLRRQAAEMSKRVGDSRGQIEALAELGDTYLLLGNFPAALETLKDAEALTRQAGSQRELARVLTRLAYVQSLQGVLYKPGERTPLHEALAIAQALDDLRQQAWIRLQWAERALAVNSLDEANKQCDEALTLTGKRMVDLSYKSKFLKGRVLLAQAQAQTGSSRAPLLEDAITWLATAHKEAAALGDQSLLAEALTSMGLAAALKGDAKALELFQGAAKALEASRQTLTSAENKAALLAQNLTVYSNIIDLLAERNQQPAAFQAAEMAKARAFLDQMTESQGNIRAGIPAALLERERSLLKNLAARQATRLDLLNAAEPDKAKLQKAESEIAKLQLDFDALKEEIRAQSPAYSSLRYPQPCQVAQVQAKLRPQQVFISYILGPARSHAFAITPRGFRYAALPKADDLTWRVLYQRDLITSCTSIALAQYAVNAAELGKVLLGPFADLLAPGAEVVFAPDGILHYLPFETLALKAPEKAPASYGEIPYLITQVAEVSYVQSATVFVTLDQNRGAGAMAPEFLLALGDPVFPGEANTSGPTDPAKALKTLFPRLPNTSKEVGAIEQAAKANGQAKSLLRGQATEGMLKLSIANARYLHIATHGVLDESNPSFSGLVLTEDAKADDDGYLYLVEIFNLRLKAELVVLSACETGLGRLVRGEGVQGLTRAFMYAGAPRLIVSLWSVDDASTATLMSSFYDRLWAKPASGAPAASVAKALGDAKRMMIQTKEYSAPYFWSPFIVVGSR